MTTFISILTRIPNQLASEVLERLGRDAARRVLAETYKINSGFGVLAMLDEQAKATGLTWLSQPTLGIEEKLATLEGCAQVLTDRELQALFNRGEGDDKLLVKLTQFYNTGQLSRRRARTFQKAGELSRDNPKAGAQAMEFRRLIWERM